jgi:hypothetical protein
MSREGTRRLFIVLGVIGLVVFVADVVLIVLDPAKPGPYFTALSGLCILLSAAVVLRATRTPPSG